MSEKSFPTDDDMTVGSSDSMPVQGTDQFEDLDQPTKKEMEFNSLGLITLWLLPLAVTYLYLQTDFGLWIIFAVSILIHRLFLQNRSIPVIGGALAKLGSFLHSLFYWLGRVTFASTEMHDDHRSIRIWWFLLVGSILNTIVLFIVGSTLSLIVPLILIIFKRKLFIRYMYMITFLPKREYVYYTSSEDRQKKLQMKAEMSKKEKGYFYFQPPRTVTHIVSYLLIFLTPYGLVLILIPTTIIAVISLGLVPDIDAFVSSIFQEGLDFALLGLIAIIPYIILDLPIWKDRKLTRWVTTRLAPRLIQNLSSSDRLNVGIFAGEYYIEEESMMLDMSDSTGFFAIFKNGRLFSILVTPLALISLLFRYLINSVDYTRIQQANGLDFLSVFVQSINILNPSGNDQVASTVFLVLIFVVPVVLSIILPLIWVINDAELKRATWYYDEVEEGFKREINSVENVGKTLLNTFKIVLGVGAISSLATSVINIVIESSASAWLITAVVVIIGSVLTLPGTFFMAYRYLGSGDHARGVNLIRFTGSQKPTIGVGTISRNYKLEFKLLEPPEEIRQLLGLGPTESLSSLIDQEIQTPEAPPSEHSAGDAHE